MNKHILLTTAAALLALGLSSCGKKDNKIQPNCQLLSASIQPSSGSPDGYTFSYNNDKKVSQIVHTIDNFMETRTLTYSGNTVNMLTKVRNATIEKRVLTLNDKGLILRNEERGVIVDTLKNTSEYTYNAKGEVVTFTYTPVAGTPSISTIAFTNGNATSISSGGTFTNFDYYTDQAFRPGDYLQFVQMQQLGNNYFLVNNKLLKSQTSGNETTNYNYTYDANNNISQVEVRYNGNSNKILFQHICD